uniref:Structural maintenance of chromosomes protein 6 n=1 Tax=Mastacembelus armatus TaxID=205130 RepID=A0A7N8X877_9TELE
MRCPGEMVTDAGIVESITLKNFMCHSLLGPFTFGSNVNFVVGNNGSECGKSAVLTALIVALGGNAQATNRGTSLKGFVKEGESAADVSITLRNKGKDAYKPEVYGPAITVDLRITRDGLRTYKLKSKLGHVISNKKEELVSILDNFNIQVNNPVSVLTQEMSKYFLHSKGEGDKYKFFMKATQLEQMREDFVYIKTTKHMTEDKVGQHGECLKDLKRKYLEKEDRYKSLASLDEMQTKLEELQKQMAWALVRLFLRFLKFMLSIWNPAPSSLMGFYVIMQNKVEEAERKYKQTQEQLERITQQVQELQPKCAELKAEAQRRNTLLKSKQEVLQRSIEANRRTVQTLESSRSNRLRRFGEHMPALLNAIQEAHKKGQFKHKPRGPLGYLISLKDPEQALAVEICLKGQLQAFTCDNYDDERVLQGLMTKVFQGGRRPAIITSQFISHVHDTRKRAVNHPEYPSVLQALEIEDPVVSNCLIDQRGIESILLIKNRTEARRVMQHGNPPQNCTQAFSREGDQIFNNRNYTADQNRASYLSGDVEEEIRYVRLVITLNISTEIHNEVISIFAVSKHRHSLQFTTVNTKTVGVTTTPQEEDLQEIVAKISSKHAEYDEARVHMAELKASYEKAEREYKQHKEQINTIAEEADSVKVILDSFNDLYFINAVLCTSPASSLQTCLFYPAVQESVAKATKISPERQEVRRTAKSLDSEINRVKVKITTQQEQGDREEIVRQYHEALENYKNMAQQMKNLNTFIKSLDSVMNHRLQVYGELRRFLAARCKYYFDSMLAQRGYTGSMIFDHKNETLCISVQPGQGSNTKLSDTRSLSGGERSFSTVCFVLSLWAITEAPFRCLDEFDVYMDMVNRRISMDMMLKVAAAQRYRQFVFLTPQSMSNLPESKLIHILRLKDPDRGHNSAQRNEDEDQ